MRLALALSSLVFFALTSVGVAQVPLASKWTYQGKLDLTGSPLNNSADFEVSLWDSATLGTQVGSTLSIDNITVVAGLFTLQLDFGTDVFDGQARWLEIAVRSPTGSGAFTTLSPRQPVTTAPYALQTRGIFVDANNHVGIGTTSPTNQLEVVGNTSPDNAILGHTTGSSGTGAGVYGQTDSTTGYGVFGFAYPGTGLNYGVYGRSNSATGTGVYGRGASGSGNNFGVVGQAQSTTGKGVYAWASSTTGNNYGLFAECNSASGYAGYFLGRGFFSGNVGFNTSNPTHPVHAVLPGGSAIHGEGAIGVEGYNLQPGGRGVYGFDTRTSGENYGVYGQTSSTQGFAGYFDGRGYFSGNVGIGTSTPGARLEVLGAGSGTGISMSGVDTGLSLNISATGTAIMVPSLTGSARAASFYGVSTSELLSTWNDGGGPALVTRGGSDASPNGGGTVIVGDTAGQNIAIDNNEIMARSNGAVSTLYLNNDGGNVVIGSAAGGTSTLATPVLQITGGADFSEQFDVTPVGDLEPEPGMVVCIDTANPAKLVMSSKPYDRTVAGVISGAGGVATGMIMSQRGSEADGAQPVALTGRVYVMADATIDAIDPGDLLTTSNVPGHAMKVRDYERAQGATLGKAMTPLAVGERGLVLVLVGLH